MYETTSPFLQSELSYRTDRLKSGLSGSNRRHRRLPLVRRPDAAIDHAR